MAYILLIRSKRSIFRFMLKLKYPIFIYYSNAMLHGFSGLLVTDLVFPYNEDMKIQTKSLILIFIVVALFITALCLQPISQQLAYHFFADSRPIFGVSNSFDVLSNIPFIFSGLFGVYMCVNFKPKVASLSWLTFFIGVILVCPGSAYYHLAPDNARLVWDRLPMTIGFMGLFTAMISTYINPKVEKPLLIFSILFGFASVYYWHLYDDLRIYFFVQFMPLAVLPMILIMFKSPVVKPKFLGFALIFYVLAKVVEYKDKVIFSGFSELLSGHTIKHLLAAISPLIIAFMIKDIHRNQQKSL
ncbi:MAG: hypothetical protein ACI9QD_001206 [Thermoproteota archaeon]